MILLKIVSEYNTNKNKIEYKMKWSCYYLSAEISNSPSIVLSLKVQRRRKISKRVCLHTERLSLVMRKSNLWNLVHSSLYNRWHLKFLCIQTFLKAYLFSWIVVFLKTLALRHHNFIFTFPILWRKSYRALKMIIIMCIFVSIKLLRAMIFEVLIKSLVFSLYFL